MIHFHDKSTVPPGGWRYLQKDTQKLIPAPTWNELVAKVRAHRKANNLPIGLEFEREIEEQLCGVMPPGVCEYTDKSQERRAKLITKTGWRKFIDGTGVFVSWALGGAKLVPMSQATEQAAICAQCEYNQKPDGCTSCALTGLAQLLATASGKFPATPHDGRLTGCMLCGCSLKAKVHFDPEFLAGKSGVEVDDYPEWCWVKKGKTE